MSEQKEPEVVFFIGTDCPGRDVRLEQKFPRTLDNVIISGKEGEEFVKGYIKTGFDSDLERGLSVIFNLPLYGQDGKPYYWVNKAVSEKGRPYEVSEEFKQSVERITRKCNIKIVYDWYL